MTAIDFQPIRRVLRGNPLPGRPALGTGELATLELDQVARDRLDYQLRWQTAQLATLIQQTTLRNTFARAILRYWWAFSAFTAALLVLQGWGVGDFHLDPTILVTLVGGTAASALGLVSVVLVGLFQDGRLRTAAHATADAIRDQPPETGGAGGAGGA